ncbi:MAG: phage tail protein, partial [Pseudomonadota bacterium]
QADRAIFGTGSREGPRLKELAVTTSSYGKSMPRHFGRMRVAGTVIWATDLNESSSTEGGKGQPKVTTYSYSASFAVALSSTPLSNIGRIWADGSLLRGATGDLKVEGQMRAYMGFGDAVVDPLIAADKGHRAPAFRDCAYVVFESLQLADFGNRIPALTFEIFAEGDASVSLKELIPQAAENSESSPLSHTRGFADEGGPLSATLSAIDRVFPISCTTTQSGLRLSSAIDVPAQILELPEQLSSEGSDDAQERHKTRAHSLGREPMALRYYDEDRDYQPGVQRAIGLRPNGREQMIDLPATMTAQGAKALANDNAHRAKWRHETIVWRIGELNPAINSGSVVRLPDTQGLWRVRSWEWYDRGIELSLERLAPGSASTVGSDSGEAQPPSDVQLAPTQLQVFEVPADDTSSPSSTIILAAATSASSAWNGAALYAEQGDTLVPIGSSSSNRAISGKLSAPLPASSALLFEPAAELLVELHASDLAFFESEISGIAAGANRLLVGNEIIQFQNAEPLGEGHWRLSGLLRGRAGTEHYAQTGHAVETPVALLDDRLTDLTNAGITSDPGLRIAAIGRGDGEAVYALLQNSGLSRRPLVPVHPRVRRTSGSALEMCWTRRARGQWRWDAQGETPLIEESEEYLVGYGPTTAPHAAFSTGAPSLTLTLTEQTSLLAAHGPADLWVRQVGTYASSDPLWLTQLS